MSYEVWVAGFPSYYGGADTELDHLIDLFLYYGVAVHLVPMFGADERMKRSVVERGCAIHAYADGVFRDKTVISLCNGQFLARLPSIMEKGRPAQVIWFNCMTWLFEKEKEAHGEGWIDYFGFQSRYQEHLLRPQLEAIRPVRSFSYRPYFNVARVEWRYRNWDGCYKIGRISRDDQAKFAADTWRIFDRVLVPRHLKKKVYILGYGPRAAQKCGQPPAGLDWMTWSGNAVPAEQFYRTIDTMVHKTGGSRENYPRVLVEAYAYGAVPIVERDYSFPQLVCHGQTGFMSSDSDEMSYYASFLAMHPEEHRRVSENGRRYLEENLSDREACWQGWQQVLEAS